MPLMAPVLVSISAIHTGSRRDVPQWQQGIARTMLSTDYRLGFATRVTDVLEAAWRRVSLNGDPAHHPVRLPRFRRVVVSSSSLSVSSAQVPMGMA